jgi:hypothetical protein
MLAITLAAISGAGDRACRGLEFLRHRSNWQRGSRYPGNDPALHAGRKPRTIPSGGLAIKEAANKYLGWQYEKLEAFEIGSRWFEDCRTILVAIRAYGRSPDALCQETASIS